MATYKQPKKVANATNSRKLEGDLATYDASVGNIDKSKGEYPVKKTGIKIRGTGAATKGVMARGPMA
jgi:hypothetical protein